MTNFELNEGRKKLIMAFDLSDKYELEHMEMADESEVYFSEKYERKMARLIKNQQRFYWRFINTAGKKVCAIVVAVLILFGGTISVSAIRDPVFSFVDKIYDKCTERIVNPRIAKNAPKWIEEVYALTKIPDGYVETEHEVSAGHAYSIYKNPENPDDPDDCVEFHQWALRTTGYRDNEHSQNQEIKLNGIIYYYSYNTLFDTTLIEWHNGEYRFLLHFHGYLSCVGAMEYALSVEKTDEAVPPME